MSDNNSALILSPETIGDERVVDDFTRQLFILHWQRIIGSWYSISSEAEPKPFRQVSQQELKLKTSTFWESLIQEILASDSIGGTPEENELKSLLNHPPINLNVEQGKEVLFRRHSLPIF